MKSLKLTVACLFTSLLFAQERPSLMPERIVVDEYHGQKLEDPYRYMENLEDEEVINWMKQNANYATSIIEQIPGKDELKKRMINLFRKEGDEVSSIHVTDDNVYYFINKKVGEEFGKLYKRNCASCEESLVYDPNNYKPNDGQSYIIYEYTPNHKGTKIALALAPNGSENTYIQLIDSNGNSLNEHIDLARAVSWLPSDDAFTYTKAKSADVTEMDRLQDLSSYVHKLGTNPENDKIILSRETHPNLNIEPAEVPVVRYDPDANLFLGTAYNVESVLKTFVAPFSEDLNLDWQPLTVKEDNIERIWAGTKYFYFLSSNNATNKKISKLPLDSRDITASEEIVAERTDETITDIAVSKDGLFYVTSKNGVQANGYYLPHNGKELKLDFPFTAGFANVSANNSRSSNIWFTISGWTSPNKRYRYNTETNTFTAEDLVKTPVFEELKNVVAKEVMVTSHDGVQVPVSIIYDKTLKMDGSNPALLLGYGGYGISMEPFFSPINLVLTSFGVVFVVPHVRGGGELGVDWHMAGQKLTKPNTWKDGIATAEYLIEQGYTSKEKIGISGGSAGGIFVGRAITERPDLFKVAAPMVGCLNMVRQEESPNGPINIPEVGTVKDELGFKGLLEMDSFHHIKKGTDYPALWITAGMNDPRVIAWQPAKFAARIQAADQDNEPILFYTDFEGGHGGGVSFSKQVEDLSNMFSFMLWQTGHQKFQPTPTKN
ncbi:MAG: prolyl oligopeptidase family serine peptidase, partial [bacterium]